MQQQHLEGGIGGGGVQFFGLSVCGCLLIVWPTLLYVGTDDSAVSISCWPGGKQIGSIFHHRRHFLGLFWGQRSRSILLFVAVCWSLVITISLQPAITFQLVDVALKGVVVVVARRPVLFRSTHVRRRLVMNKSCRRFSFSFSISVSFFVFCIFLIKPR